jgi:hypothetical protein
MAVRNLSVGMAGPELGKFGRQGLAPRLPFAILAALKPDHVRTTRGSGTNSSGRELHFTPNQKRGQRGRCAQYTGCNP